ncbi:hypothetical protein [Adhaeribacter rhizoryzae]|uniref:Uncharacterized protein n=1 Tax=Adhaeribacter rhizoryzae TaxID=2607907 RepID=A0A5M6D4S1_9BACT|nr:hypothetical protein [Adhaeribacter rhizoryzae]KAA5542518.1 hypothetical protein F0145_18920 [Adhaeribacter rhizoryzae]
MKPVKAIVLVAVLLLITLNSFGQAVGRRISETTLGIYNNSDRTLNFELGPNKRDVKAYSISSQENWISPNYSVKSKPVFRIKTAEKTKKYSVKLNNKYMIFWNNPKKAWDLTKVKTDS